MFSDEEPTDMREEEATSDVVRVSVGVGKLVMNTMVPERGVKKSVSGNRYRLRRLATFMSKTGLTGPNRRGRFERRNSWPT